MSSRAANPLGAATLRAGLPAAEPAAEPSAARGAGFRRRLRRWFWHRVMRTLTLLYSMAISIGKKLGRRPRRRSHGRLEVLLTGRFEAENWARAHLRPLAAAGACCRVTVVSTFPVPDMPKVAAVYPPAWLIRILGPTPARLIAFVCVAVLRRPDVVGGFHLLVNGLTAIALGRLIGARSAYFSVGGIAEVRGGGVEGESPFRKMETPDGIVECRLMRAVDACDLVITMGTGKAAFFREAGVTATMLVIPGGIDLNEFKPTAQRRTIDILFVGRLAEVKRLDVLLRAIELARRDVPHLTAAVVGDGELRASLEQLAGTLAIDDCVDFLGYQRRPVDWLRRARIFALTSRSEGLSLAMMEAMLCGCVPVVSDVGDLADLVADGVNGCLVRSTRPEDFSRRFVELLAGPERLASLSRSARRSASRYGLAELAGTWDAALRRMSRR